MPEYRAYIIGPNGRTLAHEFVSADRREAAWATLKFVDALPIEIWEGDAWVGTFSPSNTGGGPIFKRPRKVG